MSGDADGGTIKIRIVADDGFTTAFDKAKKGAKETGDHLGGVGAAADGMGKKLAAVAGVILSVEGALEGFNIALEQARNNDAADMFEKLGGSVDRLSQKLGQMVTNDDVVKVGNFAKSMGLTEDQIESLGSMSKQTARIMGTDVATAFEELSSGVAMGNTRMLKHAGIMVDVNVAQQNFAHSIGTSVDRLSEAGKQTAVFNAVMADQARLSRQVGDDQDTATDKLERFKASVGNLVDKLKDGLIPIFVSITEKLKPMVDTVSDLVDKLGIAQGLLASFAVMTGHDVHFVGSDQAAADAKQANIDAGDNDFGGFQMGDASVGNAPRKRSAYINPLSDQQSRDRAKQLEELAAAINDLGEAAKIAGANKYDAPFIKIRDDGQKAILDFVQKFGDASTNALGSVATPAQIWDAWGKANQEAIGKAQSEIDNEIDSGMIQTAEGVRLAGELAGVSLDNLADQLDHLAHTSKQSALSVSDISDRFNNRGLFAGGDAGRGAAGVEGLLFSMMSGGNSTSSAQGFDQMSTIAKGGAGLASGGISGMAAALGTAMGGPVGTMVGTATASAMIGAADQVGTIIGNAIAVIITDKRVGSTLGGAQSGAMIGGALGGAAGPFGIIVAPFTAVVGAVTGGMLALATSTKSYQSVQDGMTFVIDRTVKALEPFWTHGAALVGVFDIAANVFSSIVDSFGNSDAVFGVLFEMAKWTAIGLGSIVTAASYLYDAFNDLHAGISWVIEYIKEFVTNGFDSKKAAKGADSMATAVMQDFGVNLDDLNAAMVVLGSLSFDTATKMGQADEAAGAAAKSMNKLTDSVLNGPAGFRVEQYRYGAQSPSHGPGAPGQNWMPVNTTNHWDVQIMVGDKTIGEVLDELQSAQDNMAAMNTGNPEHPGGRGGYPWRGGRHGKGHG